VAFYKVTRGDIAEVARQLTEISKGNLTAHPHPWGRIGTRNAADTQAVLAEKPMTRKSRVPRAMMPWWAEKAGHSGWLRPMCSRVWVLA